MEKYGDALTLYICGYLNDPHEAEDLMIEAFSRLFAKERPIRGAGSFQAYLYKTARNLALRHRQGRWYALLRLDELATLQTDATHTTQRFSPVPGGSGDGQALPRSVERIDEARRAAEAQSAVCDAIRAEIMEVFRQLDDEVDFMILFRRYILLEDWPDIAVNVRISRSQMFQRHSAAIKRLEIKSPD